MKNLKLIITYIFVLSIVLGNRAYAYDLKGKVHELKLKNGMRWLLVERHQAPVFSGIVMVRVGGADEEQGKTGLAHMFEHMAFKGSSKLGTSDFSKEKPILDQIELTGEEITKQKLQADADKKKLTDLETKMQTLSKKAAQYQIKNEIWEIMSKNGGSEMNAFTSKDIKLKGKYNFIQGLEFADFLAKICKYDVLQSYGKVERADNFNQKIIDLIQPRYFRGARGVKGNGKKFI